ncbi:MAG TPA: hypothetical protein VFR85_17965 [Anaeromyxobacteraceae bacterium]|nr:hypothetical protein [Anaeromyxobacteraceae bacterium]
MRRALALALLAGLAVPGCRREVPGPPPERWLPADGSAALVVPELGRAARQLGAVYRTVVAVPAAAALADAYGSVKAQLGFDPFEPRGLEDAGLDPAAGAAVSWSKGRPPVAVLPVADLGRFDGTARRLARDRLGAGQRVATMGGGRQVVVFRREAAAPAALAYAVAGRYALVATGPDSAPAVIAAASVEEARSLWRSPAFAEALAGLGEGLSALAFAPARSPALAALPGARDGAALGVRASSRSLALRLWLRLEPDRAPGWAALAGSGPEAARAAGQEEARLLAPDAALAVRWGGDLAALWRRAHPFMPSRLTRALASARLDLEGGLLSALAPGAALSLSVAPTFTLTEFSSPSPDLRRADPFRLVRLEVAARVRDPARVRAFSARVAQVAPRFGARVIARGPAWTLLYGRGQLGWSIQGERLLLAGGPGRLEELERRIAAGEGGYQAPSAASRAALEGGVGGAVLDGQRLVASVQALPDEAYGTGPNAFVMRSLADRFLEPASQVLAAALRFDLLPGGAVFNLEIEGREAPRL